jgi:hypothetical protein
LTLASSSMGGRIASSALAGKPAWRFLRTRAVIGARGEELDDHHSNVLARL